jgi:hypothetical protein
MAQREGENNNLPEEPVNNEEADMLYKIGLNTDFYAFLNVKRDAKVDDIKSKFKKLSLVTHPDKL